MENPDLAELLHRHDLRVTPQRRAILSAFRGGSTEHLSAEEVLSRASSAVPEIGRGTVYATLAELAELGLLASVGTPEPIRYETNLEPHDHFRCRLCLRLFDVEFGGRSLRSRELAGFTVETVAVRAEGVCNECNSYLRGMGDGARQIQRRPTLAEDTLTELSCLRAQSPLGELALAASSEGIVRVAFEDHADFDLLRTRARSRRGPATARGRLGPLDAALGRYFGGERSAASDVIDWRRVSEDGAQALRVVQRIPYGEPLSYEHVMNHLSAYECGLLMGSNPMPLLIPSHRVTRGSERLEMYVGGLKRLRFIQELEARLPV